MTGRSTPLPGLNVRSTAPNWAQTSVAARVRSRSPTGKAIRLHRTCLPLQYLLSTFTQLRVPISDTTKCNVFQAVPVSNAPDNPMLPDAQPRLKRVRRFQLPLFGPLLHVRLGTGFKIGHSCGHVLRGRNRLDAPDKSSRLLARSGGSRGFWRRRGTGRLLETEPGDRGCHNSQAGNHERRGRTSIVPVRIHSTRR